MAIGRSRLEPVLRTPDGAKLTVTRRIGHGSPLESREARTRSRASRQAAVGQPDDREAGQSVGNVHLDEDGTASDTEQGGRWDGGDHERAPGRAAVCLRNAQEMARSISRLIGRYRRGMSLLTAHREDEGLHCGGDPPRSRRAAAARRRVSPTWRPWQARLPEEGRLDAQGVCRCRESVPRLRDPADRRVGRRPVERPAQRRS